MKALYCFFLMLLIPFITLSQVTGQDSCKKNYFCYSGRLSEKLFDSGSYIYVIADSFSYMEFSLPYFGRDNAKYRIEKRSTNDVFIVTKTYLYAKSPSNFFLAIDSTKAKESKITKKRYYSDMRGDELIILYFFSKYIDKHGLQKYFFNFTPKSFVAWLKMPFAVVGSHRRRQHKPLLRMQGR
jgi:hypothetical protein